MSIVWFLPYQCYLYKRISSWQNIYGEYSFMVDVNSIDCYIDYPEYWYSWNTHEIDYDTLLFVPFDCWINLNDLISQVEHKVSHTIVDDKIYTVTSIAKLVDDIEWHHLECTLKLKW